MFLYLNQSLLIFHQRTLTIFLCVCVAHKKPFLFILFLCIYFLGLHLRHMEVPRPGVELELKLPVYTTATTMRDLSRICDLHQRSRQGRILNPRTGIEPAPSWILVRLLCFSCTTVKTPEGVPVVAQWLTNPTRNYEVSRLIPGLAQWVQDPGLP